MPHWSHPKLWSTAPPHPLSCYSWDQTTQTVSLHALQATARPCPHCPYTVWDGELSNRLFAITKHSLCLNSTQIKVFFPLMLGINSKSKQERVFCCLLTVRICPFPNCWRETTFILNVDLASERCKWCSCPALTKLAGERESIQKAGIICLNKEPTPGFSQHKGERKVSFRGGCEQARRGGMVQPSPWLVRF